MGARTVSRFKPLFLPEFSFKSGRFVPAGAALSHMDLALWLSRQKSPKLAALTANYLWWTRCLRSLPISLPIVLPAPTPLAIYPRACTRGNLRDQHTEGTTRP